jgi:hypothetical protein
MAADGAFEEGTDFRMQDCVQGLEGMSFVRDVMTCLVSRLSTLGYGSQIT